MAAKICPFKIGTFLLDITKWKGIGKENKVNTKKQLLQFSSHRFIKTIWFSIT